MHSDIALVRANQSGNANQHGNPTAILAKELFSPAKGAQPHRMVLSYSSASRSASRNSDGVRTSQHIWLDEKFFSRVAYELQECIVRVNESFP